MNYTIKFKSKNVRKYEKGNSTSLFNLLAPSVDKLTDLICIGAEVEEDEACDILDDLLEKHNNITNVLYFLIDKLEEGGFLQDSTPASFLKEVLKAQGDGVQAELKKKVEVEA